MGKMRRTSAGFVVVSTTDLDRDDLFWENASLAEYLDTRQWPIRLMIVAAAAMFTLWLVYSEPEKPAHIVSPYPQVATAQGTRAITGNAVPNTATAVPNPIVAFATQDLDTMKIVSGIRANEQFRVTSENPRDLALCLIADGEPIVQLPDGAIVTVVGLVSLDNRWTYVRSHGGDEGWIQLKVLQRLTNDAP